MRLIDWREADPAVLAPIWHDQVARWRERLAWDAAQNWAEVEVQRRAGRLPGLILLDDTRVCGWTFFLLHRDTLQIGAFEADSPASTRILLDAVLATLEPGVAPAGVMLFGFSSAPGLVSTLVARGFDTEPYGYLVRAAGDARVPGGTAQWTPSASLGLPRLLSRAYGAPVLTRPFARQGSDAEWCEYAAQLLASNACGRFAPELSAAQLSRDGELQAAILTTIVAPGTAHIAQVAVDPAHRGQGLAARMLQAVVARVSQAGLERVSLLVSEGNGAAGRLYARAGFRSTASFISAGRSGEVMWSPASAGLAERGEMWSPASAGLY